jgi:hypothetical protein
MCWGSYEKEIFVSSIGEYHVVCPSSADTAPYQKVPQVPCSCQELAVTPIYDITFDAGVRGKFSAQ